VDEFEIIRRYFARTPSDASVLIGVGDDGAVMRPAPGRDLVSVVDTCVAGVHFLTSLDPADIGYRAVAVNVSDMAAMGARPRWMTMALTLDKADDEWLDGFARGVFEAGSRYGTALVGGDITHGAEKVISIQVTGDVEAGKAMTRDGAAPGDDIYVSGTPGDAALGLSIIESGAPSGEHADYLVRRFTRPSPRLALGQRIAGIASAAIDLSDGLFADLDKLLAASGVAGEIELDALPRSDAMGAVVSSDDALRFALGGGDDYELCFTAAEPSIVDIAQEAGTRITRIGGVVEGAGLHCTHSGERYAYESPGYRHFR
jgi:thiamine-monophosphate kinase